MTEIIKEIKRIISEHHPDVDVTRIKIEEDLIDQDFDSLLRTDIFITLGEAFGVELMDVDEERVSSLLKVAQFIELSKVSTGGEPSPQNISLGHEEFVRLLKEIGLKAGDTALVHCGFFNLGNLEHKNAEENLELVYQSLLDVLGVEGTLVVPAFYYEYGRWDAPFDAERTDVSKELGAFSSYVAKKKSAKRSIHPLTALAAVGKNAEHVTNGECLTSYGVGSAWDRFFEVDGKMLFLGVDLGSMTFVHYVEHRVGVPHIYNKYHTIPVSKNGVEISKQVSSSVRYLDFEVSYDKARYTKMFKEAGLLKELRIGNSMSFMVEAKDAFHYLVKELNRDLFFLLKNKPEFKPGEVPMSGKAGAARD